MASFAATIDKWVLETKARQEAVFKSAAQDVTEDVIDRTSVDTGFLRASLQASLVEPPAIDPQARPAKGAQGIAPPNNYAVVIGNATLGQTIYMGFTAAYARHVEYGANGRPGVGMVRLATQNWPQHVANAIQNAKAAVRRNSAQ